MTEQYPDSWRKIPVASFKACYLRHTPRSAKGFTLLELIVVIMIVAVLIGLFLESALYYMERAEKSAMEEMAGSIQSALTMQYGQMLTRGKSSDLAALTGGNPMNWMQKKPHNYAGEYYEPSPKSVPPGNWMFDLRSRELIYVPDRTDHFKPGRDGKYWVRFHVTASYEPSPLPSLHNAGPVLTGILFEPVQPYSWF